MQNLNTRMNITINPFLKEEIDTISKELGKTKSGLIAEALEYYFDMCDLKVAKKRRQNSKVLDSDEFWEQVGV